MKRPWIALPVLAAVTMLAGCAVSSADDETRTPSGSEADRAVETPGPAATSDLYGADTVALQVANQEPYGAYLADGDGRALYVFTADTQDGASTCADACAEDWPPLTSAGTPEPTGGVDAEMLGSVQRIDGTRQVTYNGWPLYYYAGDTGEGSTAGQAVQGYGGEWYLISPQGAKIDVEATNPAR